MDPSDRLHLEKMIQTNNVVDYTGEIRQKQHSRLIREDVKRMVSLARQYSRLKSSNPDQYDKILVSRCNFLFTNYTDIYNKVKKEELDLATLEKMLNVLGRIETGELDQHSGAHEVGKLLKKMYIDAALVKADRLDAEQAQDAPKRKPVKKTLTWKSYKAQELSKSA